MALQVFSLTSHTVHNQFRYRNWLLCRLPLGTERNVYQSTNHVLASSSSFLLAGKLSNRVSCDSDGNRFPYIWLKYHAIHEHCRKSYGNSFIPSGSNAATILPELRRILRLRQLLHTQLIKVLRTHTYSTVGEESDWWWICMHKAWRGSCI